MKPIYHPQDFTPDPILAPVPIWAVIVLVSFSCLIGLAVGIGKTQEYYTRKLEEPKTTPGFSCRRYETYRREMDRICPESPLTPRSRTK